MSGIVVGIDASRNRSGGARAHLTGLLSAANPSRHGIREIHVWSFKSLLDLLPEHPWLIKHNPPQLETCLLREVWWQTFHLAREAKRLGCDVLFSSDASTTCRFDPMVVMSQDMLSYEPGIMHLFRWGYQRFRLLAILHLQNWAFRHARGAIFLTRYAGDVIQRSCGVLPRVTTIPHGISSLFLDAPSVRSLAEWHTCIHCTYVSPTARYKNQWHVVRAVELLRARGIALTLDLVGNTEGCAKARLAEQLRKSDPAKSFVRQLGQLPVDKVVEQLSGTDIFVFASSCESMPITLLEGMAMGLPIACSERGPMPEVLQDGGVYFDPEDPLSIADAIERIVLDRDLRIRIAERAREISSNFSWQRSADETLAFIARTCAPVVATRSGASVPQGDRATSRNVTIIGHGFLGKSLIDGLAGESRQLQVLCRKARSSPPMQGVSYHVGDAGDPGSLETVIRPGLTVFAAGSTFPALPPAELQALAARELEILRQVLAQVASYQGRLVYLSSSAVYGEVPSGMARETDVSVPISSYGRHKLMCEQYCRKAARELGVQLTVLRLSNPFGPRQISARRQGLIGIVLDNVRNDRTTQIRGDGEDIRDYVPVAVLAAVVARLADDIEAAPEILNVCSGTGLKTSEVLALLGNWLGRPIPVEYTAHAAGEIRRSVLDPRSLRRWAPGALPDADFAAGLAALTPFRDSLRK